MKKLFCKIYAVFMVFFVGYIFNLVNAHNIGENIKGTCVPAESSYSQIKKINFGNDMEYVIEFKVYPERTRLAGEDGRKEYDRFAVVTGVFYSTKSGAPVKMFEHKVKVTFTYDKKSFVKISNPDEDIDCSKMSIDDDKWKLAQTYEILGDNTVCVFSEMFTVFKQQKLTDRTKYIENSHVDMACNIQGDLAISSKGM